MKPVRVLQRRKESEEAVCVCVILAAGKAAASQRDGMWKLKLECGLEPPMLITRIVSQGWLLGWVGGAAT